MFRDDITHRSTLPGQKMTKVVVERRPRQYMGLDEEGKEVVIGEGWEIVKELKVGPEGLALMKEVK